MPHQDGLPTGDDFDIVVVGAGPAAVAALDALATPDASTRPRRIAVLTGAVPSAERRHTLHPKIQAVSLAQAEAAGVAERITASGARARPIFSTAAVGGLANYWGQQFVRWSEHDPWPRDAFADFDAYERACARVERLFALDGGETLGAGAFGGGVALRRPRLLAGAAGGGGTGLTAMRLAFVAAAQATSASVLPRRALRLAPAGGRWAVELDDGSRLVASRVLLAAGVIGDGQLLLRSFPDLERLQFTDHTPWLLFTLGAQRHFPMRAPGPRPFNALTVQRDRPTGCDLFASFYDMRGADLNLLLASTLGRAHPWLKGWPSPPGAGLVTPVQVWTPHTYGRVEIAGPGAAFASELPPPGGPEREMAAFVDQLGGCGCRVLRAKRTQPAFGYHYHRLRFRPQGGAAWSEVGDLLRDRTDGMVDCVDGASLKRIGCQPHTLTVMARAAVRARVAAQDLTDGVARRT